MPEGFIPMSQTVIYLALAPKSNSAYSAYLRARKEIKENRIKEVPLHLRNPSTKLDREWNYGKNYKYPHAFKESWVDQQYLPDELKDKKFYHPKKEGKEPSLLNWLKSKTKNKY